MYQCQHCKGNRFKTIMKGKLYECRRCGHRSSAHIPTLNVSPLVEDMIKMQEKTQPPEPVKMTQKHRPVDWLIFVFILVFCLLLIASKAFAKEVIYADFNQIVDAIYLAEGGAKAKKPYGILSVPCTGLESCRRICYNTVRNNWHRWRKAGKTEPYLAFLARRYAPIGAENDPTGLNRHWLKNVRSILIRRSRNATLSGLRSRS